MADTPDTPTTPAAKPTTRRRATRAPAAKAPAKKPAAPKPEPAPAPKAEAAPKRPTTPKPRSTKRATPAPKRKSPAKATPAAAAEKTGGKWNTAVIAGGVAAIGAVATAALLALRSSTPKATPGAHTADGTDASKSFEAGIADEGTVPDEV